VLRAAFAAHSGVEVDTQGDAFVVAFATALAAVVAAAEATRALAAHAWPQGVTLRVRMGLHTGTPQVVGDHYVGLDVHRAARIAATGHGGRQVLLSQTTRHLVEYDLPEGVTLRDQVVQRGKSAGRHQHTLLLKCPEQPSLLFSLVFGEIGGRTGGVAAHYVGARLRGERLAAGEQVAEILDV
jgi:class 3 adenylate cyclase